MVTKNHDYPAELVAAAYSVLLELAHLLGAYRNDIVVVGGWVPGLLLPASAVPHIGSIDVDLALDHQALDDPRYQTLRESLFERGYVQSDKQPFSFFRTVISGERTIRVQVDLLAGEYQGTGHKHRHQQVQDLKARKARGCDLAFELNTTVRLEGALPNGALDAASIQVASVVPFFVMKAMALADRMKEKDAWDIYYMLLHTPGGVASVAAAFQDHLAHGLVQEGLAKLSDKFASPGHIGPRFVADFEELTDPDERARIMRDAFERVNDLLVRLGARPAR